jgi:hypothetical protein
MVVVEEKSGEDMETWKEEAQKCLEHLKLQVNDTLEENLEQRKLVIGEEHMHIHADMSDENILFYSACVSILILLKVLRIPSRPQEIKGLQDIQMFMEKIKDKVSTTLAKDCKEYSIAKIAQAASLLLKCPIAVLGKNSSGEKITKVYPYKINETTVSRSDLESLKQRADNGVVLFLYYLNEGGSKTVSAITRTRSGKFASSPQNLWMMKANEEEGEGEEGEEEEKKQLFALTQEIFPEERPNQHRLSPLRRKITSPERRRRRTSPERRRRKSPEEEERRKSPERRRKSPERRRRSPERRRTGEKEIDFGDDN